MIFVGIDWAEQHHDVCLISESGELLAQRRISDDLEGVKSLHELLFEHGGEKEQVVVGIETDSGLLVQSLIAADYQIYAINPLSVSRYRDRHTISRAKSDSADAKLLAELVRTDRQNHRPIALDSELAEAVKTLGRTHKSLGYCRQRLVNQLRSTLRDFYPAALNAFQDLACEQTLAILSLAPSPNQALTLTKNRIKLALKRAGRQRYLDERTQEIFAHFHTQNLQAPPLITQAQAHNLLALVGIIKATNLQLANLDAQLKANFESHPDAVIYLSLPGLGVILGAGALGEFGDDPNRFSNPKARKNYAGTSPITRASGTKRMVMARFARSSRLADLTYLWAFSSLQASKGCHNYYKQLRSRNKTHTQALHQLANRLVGILHGCLKNHQLYDEDVAWPKPTLQLAA